LDDNCVPAITSDGLRSYFYTITAHFGYWFRPERARTDQWQSLVKMATMFAYLQSRETAMSNARLPGRIGWLPGPCLIVPGA
jgi:hypothetical protein